MTRSMMAFALARESAWRYRRYRCAGRAGGSHGHRWHPDRAADAAACCPKGVASITCRQTQAAVGLAVTLTCTSSRLPWPRSLPGRPGQHRELMTEQEILGDQCLTVAYGRTEKAEQKKEILEHRLNIMPLSARSRPGRLCTPTGLHRKLPSHQAQPDTATARVHSLSRTVPEHRNLRTRPGNVRADTGRVHALARFGLFN